MKYKTVLSELLTNVPEIEPIVREKMLAEDIAEEDGMHIIFPSSFFPCLGNGAVLTYIPLIKCLNFLRTWQILAI